MSFESPQYLILLLFIPALYFLENHLKKIDTIPFPSVKFVTQAAKESKIHINKNSLLLILKFLALSFFILSLARPQRSIETQGISSRGIDIILCMDTSTSMKALDFNPKNRFEAAVEAAKEFVKARKNDRIGIVAFSGLSFTYCPLTTDRDAVINFIDNMHIGMTTVDGTNISAGILTSVERLKQTESPSKVIILLTDGRHNIGEVDPITAAKAAASVGIKIYTIGAALPGRALYPIDDPVFGRRFVYVQDDLDEQLLKEIANITGGSYFRVTAKDGLSTIYRQIDKLEKADIRTEKFTERYEMFHAFLIPGFLFFGLSIFLDKVLMRGLP